MPAKSSLAISLPDAMVIPTGASQPVAVALPTAVERIVEAARPVKIILFGSYAYGTPTPDSDVDLHIVMETAASPVERYASISEALWPRQFPVDILVKTPDELRQAIAAGDAFIIEVLRRGRVLYEQPN